MMNYGLNLSEYLCELEISLVIDIVFAHIYVDLKIQIKTETFLISNLKSFDKNNDIYFFFFQCHFFPHEISFWVIRAPFTYFVRLWAAFL